MSASSTSGNIRTALTMPTTFRQIIPDGNCFFRCISFAITGSEHYHDIIRQSICEYMSTHPDDIRTYLPADVEGNVLLYLQRSRMEMNTTWASEVEIFASAFLLQTNVYIYTQSGVHWVWLRHSPPGNVSDKGIYIVHRNQNHYDVVLSVQNSPGINCESENTYTISKPKDLTAQQRQNTNTSTHRKRYKEDPGYRTHKKNTARLRYWLNQKYITHKMISEELRPQNLDPTLNVKPDLTKTI